LLADLVLEQKVDVTVVANRLDPLPSARIGRDARSLLGVPPQEGHERKGGDEVILDLRLDGECPTMLQPVVLR